MTQISMQAIASCLRYIDQSSIFIIVFTEMFRS